MKEKNEEWAQKRDKKKECSSKVQMDCLKGTEQFYLFDLHRLSYILI